MLKLHELLIKFVRRFLSCKNELTMGNTLSSSNNNNNNVSAYDSENNSVHHEKTNRVLFFLHRTWSIIVTEKWTSRSRIRRSRDTTSSDINSSDYDSQFSQYSFCSCSQCQRDDGFSSGCDSILFESGSSMAPNSEESARIGQFPFVDDNVNKEKQRPPIYNPEDYALSLKKWGRKPPNGNGLALYNINTTNSDTECSRTHSNSFRDYRNPMLTSSGSEMMLRQFVSVSELLAKLKSDLKLAYPSFVQEFVGDPLDGVTLLLDLLRAIQLSQSNNGPGSNNTTGKLPPSLQRKALLDELSCLQCLLNCCTRYSDAVRKLTASSAGLFTLAICIMSNVNKSRIVALQLLTKACCPDGSGHTSVSEALSTLRLRFGEPVRFRFLVGMLASAGGQGELLASGMKFLNTFLCTAGSAQKRLYIQAELEQAGFDIVSIKKNIAINSSSAEDIFEEMDNWEKNHIDVETLAIRVESSERENDSLRDKVLLLERRIQILQEEKGILMSLEQCLKDRCSELQDEVHSLKSENSIKNSTKITLRKKGDPSGIEDEGISSSERSLTPEEDVQRESSIYEVYSVPSETRQAKNDPNTQNKTSLNAIDDDDEEETTIDEVIEELKNIINDAETEAYKKEEQKLEQERRKIEEAQVASKIKMRVNGHLDLDDFALDQENEIIPSNLHPQPPRKAKSLIHLFIPAEDYDYGNKEMFFENETAFTSDESSDSLLSASKCRLPRLEKDSTNCLNENTRINDVRGDKISCHKSRHSNAKRTPSKASVKRSESFRHVHKNQEMVPKNGYDSSYYYNTPVLVSHQKEKQKTLEELTAQRVKSKSLDRIDDGLESMVDIVVTDQKVEKNSYQFRTKSDSGNMTAATSLSRSISNIFTNTKKDSRSKLSNHSDDKQKMFLPSQRSDQSDVPYYFPRIQEKRNNTTFLIKRGHGNAGMYSGQIIRENNSSLSINKEYMSSSSTCRLSGKVTDLPSGLY